MVPDYLKRGRLISLFLLGLILFNYPILAIFNRPALFFGIPLLYLYLFVVWFGFIVGIAWIASFIRPERASKKNRNHY